MNRELGIQMCVAVKVRALGIWLFLMDEQRACKDGYLLAPAEAREQFHETVSSLRKSRLISIRSYDCLRAFENKTSHFVNEEQAVENVCDLLGVSKEKVDEQVRAFADKCNPEEVVQCPTKNF